MLKVIYVKKIISILCSLSLIFISGCSFGVPKACGTNYPVVYLLNRIGGSYIEVCNLSSNDVIQRATISDTYEEDLKATDFIFYISSLEPYYPIYNNDLTESKATVVDLAKTSAIYKFQRYTTTVIDNQTLTIETPYYEGDVFKNIDTYDMDVTMWMDPISMMSMANTIKEQLINAYPENKESFQDNYMALEVELAQLDAAFQNLQTANPNIAFVSVTPNFGNWQKSYGFRVYPLILSKYGALPSEEQLQIMMEKIKTEGVKYIVHEDNLSEDMEALFVRVQEELQLQKISINNISSLTQGSKDSNKDYLTMMYENLAQIEAMGK